MKMWRHLEETMEQLLMDLGHAGGCRFEDVETQFEKQI